MQPDHGTCSTGTNVNEGELTANSFISDCACQLSLICTHTVRRATGLSQTHQPEASRWKKRDWTLQRQQAGSASPCVCLVGTVCEKTYRRW